MTMMRGDMKPYIRDKVDRFIEKTKADEQILAVFLFGSAAREENSPKSDIDVALVMGKDTHTQEFLFQKRLRYLEEFDLDVQIFESLPVYIRNRIIKEGRILFCRDEDRLYALVFKVIQEFEDFNYIYQDYLKEVARAG